MATWSKVGAAAETLPLAVTAAIDAVPLLRALGQLQIGSLGFAAATDDGQEGRVSGTVSIEATIPLALLDLREPSIFWRGASRSSGSGVRGDRGPRTAA